jgi:beta-galactosidase
MSAWAFHSSDKSIYGLKIWLSLLVFEDGKSARLLDNNAMSFSSLCTLFLSRVRKFASSNGLETPNRLSTMRILISLAFQILICLTFVFAQRAFADSSRERLLMDFGWRFNLGDAPDAGTNFNFPEPTRLDKTIPDEIGLEGTLAAAQPDPVAVNLGGSVSFAQPDFDDSDWRKLNLPHDWAVELPFDTNANWSHGYKAIGPGYNTNNIGWYRRTFSLPAEDKNKTLWLEFDGAYRDSTVWLNGHCLGHNASGYSSFYFDIDKYANFGGKNTIAVRLDASRFEGWFYEGAGIYRHVWLVKTNPLHIAHDGVFVYSRFKDNVPVGPAEIHAQVDLESPPGDSDNASVEFEILDPSGKSVGKSDETVGEGFDSGVQSVLIVSDPELWSPESPKLYTLLTTVTRDGQTVDEVKTPFGIRTVAFDANKGFILNGKPYFINGTCNHQDFAGVGVALPDRIEYDRVVRLKEMGANGFRTAHNVPAPELLDACDQLGMLVLDENRRMDSSPQTLDEVKRMILRDRNHPSIFAWSLGNEEVDIQGTSEGGAVATAMAKVIHDLDPTRSVTAAMNFGWGKGFTPALDFIGLNYTRNGDPDKYHTSDPDKSILNTETGSSYTTRGIYTGGRGANYQPAYDLHGSHSNVLVDGIKRNLTAEEWENYYAQRPYMSSVFIWTGFDYRGEAKWPFVISPMGAIDTCGFPKDLFYYFQSAWGNKPMLHLLPDWNSPRILNKPVLVVCYTTCEQVELFLNGKSLGRKPVSRYGHAEWRVSYVPGTLLAKGYLQGSEIMETKVETTGAPVAVQLIPDRMNLHGDGRDVSLVTVEAIDAWGRMVPDAKNLIYFHVSGGTLLGVGNGDPASHESDTANCLKLFSGLAQAIIQAPQGVGEITLTADSPGLKTATITLNADSVRQPFVP